MSKGSKTTCPDCKSPLTIRTSREMSSTTREIRMYCTNIESCGGSYLYHLSLYRTLTPPRKSIEQMAIEILSFLPRDARKMAIQQINKESEHE